MSASLVGSEMCIRDRQITIMNTIKTLLLLSFSILLFNCSDEEDKKTEKEFIFSASELKQTEWEGEFLYLTNGEIDSKGSIKIVFYTEKKGVCEYKFDYHIDPETISFEYEISDKFMYIDGPLPIHGNWIQQKYNGNSLEIADSKAAFTNSRMIKLTRVN